MITLSTAVEVRGTIALKYSYCFSKPAPSSYKALDILFSISGLFLLNTGEIA